MKKIEYVLFPTILLLILFFIYCFVHLAKDISVSELVPKWSTPDSKFLKIQGMEVHITDEGLKNNQDPIVLIHGTSASLHTWDGWVKELKNKRRVIRIDLPGFGLTGPHPTSNYSIENYVRTIVSVLDKLNIKRFIIAGNSLGGYVSWMAAILNPERVSKLILVNSSGYLFEPESVPLAFLLSYSSLTSFFTQKILPRHIVKSSLRNVYGDPNLVNEDLVDRYYQLTLREGNRIALTKRLGQLEPGAYSHRISKVKQPTLILWGKKDRLIPLKFGIKFHEQINNSRLVVFDDLGHVPQEENPEATVKEVIKFLDN